MFSDSLNIMQYHIYMSEETETLSKQDHVVSY